MKVAALAMLVDELRAGSSVLHGARTVPVPQRLRVWADADRTTLAIAGIVISALLIAVSDVCSKVLTRSLPAIEVAWLRYAVFCLLVLPLLARGTRGALRTVRPGCN